MEMDLKNYLSREKLKEKKSQIKKVFFYRISGTGMGAAACLMREAGYEVFGCDSNFYPPMGDYLKKSKIPLYPMEKINEEFLKSFDLIIVGNVIGGKSQDARLIEKSEVPFASFPAGLGALILDDQNVVALAGTHGKTTTVYLCMQVFKKLGFNPGYLIGGVIDGENSSGLGDGSYFFIEADEYDSSYFEKFSKFRSYNLSHMILTSLEFDHGDIFNSLEDIKDQFRASLPNLKTIVASLDYPAILDLKDEFPNLNWKMYGKDSIEGPKITFAGPDKTVFSLGVGDKDEVFETNLVGPQNILNLSSVLLFALSKKIPLEKLKKSIGDLKMVKRRQEVRGTYKEALVIDDFAHHPRAVSLTFDSVKQKYPKKEIVVVMEPGSATARSDIFQEEFLQALYPVDRVILAKPPRPTSIASRGNLDCYKMVDGLKEMGKYAAMVENLGELRKELDKLAGPNILFLVLSNGTCLGLWESDFVEQLKK